MGRTYIPMYGWLSKFPAIHFESHFQRTLVICLQNIQPSLFRWSYSHNKIMLLCVQKKKYCYSEVLLNFRHLIRSVTILLFNPITDKITTWFNFVDSQQHKRDRSILFSACKYELSSWFNEKSHSGIQTPDSLQ